MPEYRVSAAAMQNRCFTVRYAFRPDSLDTCESMQLRKDEDEGTGSYSLALDGGEPGFGGSVTAAKDVECVLVWNSEEQAYELRQLDFALRMNALQENPKHSRHRRRQAPTPSSAALNSTKLATPQPTRASATPEPFSKTQSTHQAPSPATTPSLGATRRFKAPGAAPRSGSQSLAAETIDVDDFDDLANQLADELGVVPPPVRAIGTAGPNLDDEEEMSEEE